MKSIPALPLSVLTAAVLSATATLVPMHAHAELVMEEVTVTARKREESLQDIPVAANVFSAEALEMRNATDVSDVMLATPNVAYQDRAGGHQTSISIRGIASDVRNIGLDDSVGVYVDGVFIGRPMFYNMDLAEIERVEILKGPQGTLFGKNTIAGAINITTRDVPEEFEGKVTLSAGNYGLQYGKAYLGGSFGAGWGASVSVVSKQTDGYMKNLSGGPDLQAIDQQGGAAKLQYNGDSIKFTLQADTSEKDNRANASQVLRDGSFGLGLTFGDQDGPFVVDENPDYQRYQEDVSGYSAGIDWELDSGYSVTALYASRQMDLDAKFDDDNTSSPVDVVSHFIDESEQQSLELRLASPGGETFDWILGAYWFQQDITSDRSTTVFGLAPIGVSVDGDGWVEAESQALFFSGDYHINESLDLNIGLRYTTDDKKSYWTQTGLAAPAFGLPVLSDTIPDPVQKVILGARRGDESWDDFSPTVALTYRPSDDVSLYVKYSEGFKSGGFMMDLVGELGYNLEPEYVKSYEGGIKSDLIDGKLRLNAAVYQMDYTDLQTQNLQGLQFVGSNAGQAEITGVEMDFQWLLTSDFRLSGGMAWNDAEYVEFDHNINGVIYDRSGNKAKVAPEWTANLTAEYATAVGNDMEFQVVVDWAYKDDVFYNVENNANGFAPSYNLLNLRVSLGDANDAWKVSLWGKNVADEEYYTYLRDGPFGEASGLYGEPATYGVDLTLNF